MTRRGARSELEVLEACRRWRARPAVPVQEGVAEHAVRALYRVHDLPEPAIVEVVPSPAALVAVARFRLDPSRDEEDFGLAPTVWREALRVEDTGLTTSIERALRVNPEPTAVQQVMWEPPDELARRYGSSQTRPSRNSHGRYVSPMPTRSALAALIARELLSLDAAPFVAVLDACEWLCLAEHRAIVSLHPEIARFDDRGEPHADAGPALRWGDGTELWCWRGRNVGRTAIEAPEQLLLGDVADASVRTRRALIERYGLGRYMLDAGAESIARDDAGELYRLEQSEDEPLVAVRVVDRARGPKGEPKEHWLRVPPNTRSARAAVAWTFGIEPRRYRPVREA